MIYPLRYQTNKTFSLESKSNNLFSISSCKILFITCQGAMNASYRIVKTHIVELFIYQQDYNKPVICIISSLLFFPYSEVKESDSPSTIVRNNGFVEIFAKVFRVCFKPTNYYLLPEYKVRKLKFIIFH